MNLFMSSRHGNKQTGTRLAQHASEWLHQWDAGFAEAQTRTGDPIIFGCRRETVAAQEIQFSKIRINGCCGRCGASHRKDHVRMDAIASESDKISTMILRNQQMAGKEAHFLGLKMQGESPKVIIESISRKNLTSWNNLFDRLPQFLFQFARKALQQQLPTASNLYRWKKLQSPMCTLCGITFFRIVPPRRHWIVTRSYTTTSCRSSPIGSLHRNPRICSSSWTCRLRHSVRLMMCFKRASGSTWFCTTVVTIFSFWNCLCVTNPTCKKLDCTNKTNTLTFLKI